MGFDTAVLIIRQGVLHVLLVAAPALLIGMGVGLVIAVLQATTSIQEQTLTFVPKIVAILGSLVIFGPWMISTLVEFTRRLFESISTVGG